MNEKDYTSICGAEPILNMWRDKAWMQKTTLGMFFLSYISVVSGRKIYK